MSKMPTNSREDWLALYPGAHEGYVDWERSEAIRAMIKDNSQGGVVSRRCEGVVLCERWRQTLRGRLAGGGFKLP